VEYETIATYEGPCSGVQINTLTAENYEEPQALSGGVFAREIWRTIAQNIPCEAGKSYRITVEVER